MASKSAKKTTSPQVKAFRKAARELEADESEERFDAALRKIIRHKARSAPARAQKKAND
ncbi:MAG TPA: hypothetical protein VFA57_18945 [Pseudolabrys sp.]|nr:hypothetical protein [Pseudolabrys sp.]